MSNSHSSSLKALRHFLIAASAITLAACATATPYQEASKPGAFDGFSQQLIENDRARISFGGNSLTNRETVENYLLYRAAEVAVENGYETFTLQESDVEQKSRTNVSPGFNSNSRFDPFFGYSFFRPGFGWSRNFAFSRFGGFRSASSFGRSGFGRSSFGRSGFNRGGFGFGRSSFGGNGFGGDPFFNGVNVSEITKYRAIAEVKFGNDVNSEDERTFNAQEVLDNLGDSIELPEEKT